MNSHINENYYALISYTLFITKNSQRIYLVTNTVCMHMFRACENKDFSRKVVFDAMKICTILIFKDRNCGLSKFPLKNSSCYKFQVSANLCGKLQDL